MTTIPSEKQILKKMSEYKIPKTSILDILKSLSRTSIPVPYSEKELPYLAVEIISFTFQYYILRAGFESKNLILDDELNELRILLSKETDIVSIRIQTGKSYKTLSSPLVKDAIQKILSRELNDYLCDDYPAEFQTFLKKMGYKKSSGISQKEQLISAYLFQISLLFRLETQLKPSELYRLTDDVFKCTNIFDTELDQESVRERLKRIDRVFLSTDSDFNFVGEYYDNLIKIAAKIHWA